MISLRGDGVLCYIAVIDRRPPSPLRLACCAGGCAMCIADGGDPGPYRNTCFLVRVGVLCRIVVLGGGS